MRLSVVTVALSLCIVGVSAAGPAEASIKKHVEIPAQGLGPALQTLAEQHNFQVVYKSEVVGDLRTLGAAGELTLTEALTQLLSGTGLTYEYLDDHAITILPLASGNPPSSKAEGEAPAARQGGISLAAGTAAALDPAKKPGFWDRFRLAQNDQSSRTSAAAEDKESSRQDLPSPQETGKAIPEILVTAQKRSERLQDVPVPVTAIDADSLVNSNQLRLQDYYTRVPGLSFAMDNRGASSMSIRGVTTGAYVNPTIGITIDDVPYGATTVVSSFSPAPDVDPNELARVEVLRGPQGTLYGASSMGGLLKFVTIEPSTDRVSGRLQVGTTSVHNGDGPGYNVSGAANLPLGDTLAVRASGFTHLEPGYIDNPVTGVDGVNEQRVSGGRISTLWRPSESVSLKLNALLQQGEAEGSSQVTVHNGLGDLQQDYLKGTGGYDRKIQAYSGNLTAKLGNIDLTAIGAYGVSKTWDSYDTTSGLEFFTQQVWGVPSTPWIDDNRTTKFTQEIRFSGPIGQRVDWLFGGFYTRESNDLDGGWWAADPVTGVLIGRSMQQLVDRSYKEYAAFADLTFQITDRFDLQVGGRESKNKQTYQISSTGPFVPLLYGQPSPLAPPEADSKDNSFTYLVTPRFKMSPNLMMYARLASGYRPGGPNPNQLLGIPPSFEPDITQNYEIGVKGDFLDRSLSVDASVYYIDWKDIQLALFDPILFQEFTGNGSRAKSQGVELAVESRPLTGLTISAWVAWNDAKLTEDFPSIGSAFGNSGDRLPYSSRFAGSLSLDDEFPVGKMTGFVGGTISYAGDRIGEFASIFGSPDRQTFPSYTKTDLRAGMRYDSWTMNFFVNNLTDKRALLEGGLGRFPAFGFNYIQPRTVGLSFSKSF